MQYITGWGRSFVRVPRWQSQYLQRRYVLSLPLRWLLHLCDVSGNVPQIIRHTTYGERWSTTTPVCHSCLILVMNGSFILSLMSRSLRFDTFGRHLQQASSSKQLQHLSQDPTVEVFACDPLHPQNKPPKRKLQASSSASRRVAKRAKRSRQEKPRSNTSRTRPLSSKTFLCLRLRRLASSSSLAAVVAPTLPQLSSAVDVPQAPASERLTTDAPPIPLVTSPYTTLFDPSTAAAAHLATKTMLEISKRLHAPSKLVINWTRWELQGLLAGNVLSDSDQPHSQKSPSIGSMRSVHCCRTLYSRDDVARTSCAYHATSPEVDSLGLSTSSYAFASSSLSIPPTDHACVADHGFASAPQPIVSEGSEESTYNLTVPSFINTTPPRVLWTPSPGILASAYECTLPDIIHCPYTDGITNCPQHLPVARSGSGPGFCCPPAVDADYVARCRLEHDVPVHPGWDFAPSYASASPSSIANHPYPRPHQRPNTQTSSPRAVPSPDSARPLPQISSKSTPFSEGLGPGPLQLVEL